MDQLSLQETIDSLFFLRFSSFFIKSNDIWCTASNWTHPEVCTHGEYDSCLDRCVPIVLIQKQVCVWLAESMIFQSTPFWPLGTSYGFTITSTILSNPIPSINGMQRRHEGSERDHITRLIIWVNGHYTHFDEEAPHDQLSRMDLVRFCCAMVIKVCANIPINRIYRRFGWGDHLYFGCG